MSESKSLSQLERGIGEALQCDQHRLRGQLRSLERARQRGDSYHSQYEQLVRQLEDSCAERARRDAGRPAIHLDLSLPISAQADEIAAAIREHQVVVVCGETGSGKSTQIPKICLREGRGIRGLIGHTQPRRIAARSIAARLSQELASPLGGHVGYKIRFTDTVQRHSYIKLMTDGILLAETQQDRFLDQYDTLIIDEAHERSLNIDFLLGYLRQLLPKRRDLRLIITSATIDAARFAEHFGTPDRPAPVLDVAGRSYPVETRYRALRDPQSEDGEADEIVAALDELAREGPGDILVFLPTEREIRDVTRRVRGWSLGQFPRPEILPLYARLSTAEQNRVFQPGGKRRVILATNVAESSLTVPGIRYVIDTGTARISRYAPRSKVQRLPIEPVSRASADQRQGRCGRVAPGICIRLYNQEDYLARDAYSTPEIRRTNLAAVILQMLALKLGELEQFPFLDPPRPEAIRDGYKTLFELGAIDHHRRLTPLGRTMSRLPVDPRIARMILAGHDEGCLSEILIIAAVLEIQDPRERPADKQQQADERHAAFADPHSDFLSYLKLWDFIHRLKADLSRSKLQKACQQNFLSFTRIREWQDIHRQLKQQVSQIGLHAGSRRDEYDRIHRALLTGLLSNIAMRSQRYEYQAAGSARSFLWPGSGIFATSPQWVVAAEAIETSKRYLRTVARIDSQWIEPLAEHLVKRSYRDPHWSRKQNTVMAYENVTLFGLLVVANRRIRYGTIDPQVARHLFIEQGLVAKDVALDADFYVHNCQLIQQIESLAAKSRRPSYLVGDGTQVEFYESRLPEDVFDVASLREWLGRATSAEAQRLQMTAADLVPDFAFEGDAGEAFPDRIQAGELRLKVDYRYEPGHDADGLSVTVPREACGQLDPELLEWGVPGLLEEKLLALIRSLPKPIRRSLVPAPESARRAAAAMVFGAQPFLPAAAATLSKLAGEPIPITAFDLSKMPPHLRVNVRVVDETGEVVAQDRDLERLRQQLPLGERSQVDTIRDSDWEQDGLTSWTFGTLPAEVTIRRGGIAVTAFPTLLDCGDSVAVRLSHDRQAADRGWRSGLRRLICLAEHRELKSQVNWLPRLSDLELFASTLRPRRDLRKDLGELLAELGFVRGAELSRTPEEFTMFRQRGRQQLLVVVQDVARLMVPLWETYHAVTVRFEEAARLKQAAAALGDLRRQLAALMAEGFLVETPWQWLMHYPRYLQGMLARLDKLALGGHARDADCLKQIEPLQAALDQRQQRHAERGMIDAELEEYRWMLEEFRVSLFAQQLGTSIKVSPQRLQKQWDKAKQ